ncbi:hypothetical protein PG985_016181 [Apiospora marii]|uniref:uncharacterized protein n=1 Tax=Apiospora marii TaxID=335849 RepID=UPI003130E821
MYIASRELWACCSISADGRPDCTQQSNETFDLAPPQDLRPFFSIPSSGSPYSSASMHAHTSSAMASAPSTTASSQPAASRISSSSTHTSSLSPGAAAGIGVASGIAILLFSVAGIATWYRRRNRRQDREHQVAQLHQKDEKTPGPRNMGQPGALGKPELNGQCLPRELSGEMLCEMQA